MITVSSSTIKFMTTHCKCEADLHNCLKTVPLNNFCLQKDRFSLTTETEVILNKCKTALNVFHR